VIEGKDICFVGLGTSAVCYYRCLLPARALGADWCGLAGEPPKMGWVTGLARGQSEMPPLPEYKVVIIQQPRGRGWMRIIHELQDAGVKVIYEIDDYLHAIRKRTDHDFSEEFSKKQLVEFERCMGTADALIGATEFIARRYRKFNQRTFTVENGLDVARYDLTLPERSTVNIGWAGATGHLNSLIPWLQATASVMRQRDNTCFASIGHPAANGFREQFGNRCIATPWAAIEQYPGAMTMMDIAIAPAGRSGFFQGKSDLRWLEAGALGIPVIADPFVYGKIDHGVNGFHAESPAEVEELLLELVDDDELRTTVGANARSYVREHRDINVMAKHWLRVIEEVVGEDTAEQPESPGVVA
jgi:glycosyltransferase involved in cell wall biosynthesis